jgi:hypothetical protein
MDTKLSPAHTDPRRDDDVVVLAPKDWMDAEKVLSQLAQVSDRRRLAAGSDFCAGPRVTEPSLDATLRPAEMNIGSFPTNRHPPGRRTSRSLAHFLMAACLGVATTLAWQSYGGTAKQMIASSAPQIGWLLLSPPATEAPSGPEIVVEQPSPPGIQAPAPQVASAQAGAVASTSSEMPASSAPTAPSLQQLEAMAHDLAAVRQSVEQLAAGQEEMARDIAKLQAAEQDIRRRISAIPPAAATTARKPVPPPQPAPHSAAAPFPPAPPQPAPQSSAAPLPPAPPEPPLRPPMPMR